MPSLDPSDAAPAAGPSAAAPSATDSGAATAAPSDAPREGAERHDARLHGPFPSYEWVLEGGREIILPHLQALAPALAWNREHFHVTATPRADADLPELFEIALTDAPVGAVDFLPLPAERTLMRLYLCSDLGTVCAIDGGNDVIQGFATAWLARLRQLGFLSQPAEAATRSRPLGFRTPRPDRPEEVAPRPLAPDGTADPADTAAQRSDPSA